MKEYTIDDFFQFEKKNNLFCHVDKHGTNLWDLVRYDVYKNISAPRADNSIYYRKISLKRVLRLLAGALKWGLSIFKKYDYLFFLSSRNNKNGIPIDINFIDTIQYVSSKENKTIAIETYADIKELRYDFDTILPLFPLTILRVILGNKYSYNFYDLHKKIISNYPECTLSVKHFERIYLNFYTEKVFYRYFIKKWGCKTIFITQNGVYKGLFAACKEVGVNAIEYQHGAIVKSHPIYSYPQLSIPYKGLSLPTYLCVYSEQWLKGVNLPYTKVVEIGNDTLYTQPSSVIDEHNILVISAHGSLGDMILDFIIDSLRTGRLDNYNIYYKLHPYQSCDYESYVNKTAKYANFHIIKDGNSLDYIQYSKHIIAVSSTCIYEALQHNVNIYILKLPTYTQMNNVFHLKNVFIVENPNDLINIITKTDYTFISESVLSFYKPFNREVLNNLI